MFPFDDKLLTGLYTLPFIFAMTLPGWRSIAIVALSGIALATFITATAGGGIASALGVVMTLAMAFGLCCGLATRAASLRIAPLGRHPVRFMFLAVVGYLAGPIVYSGPAATTKWLSRPSPQTCSASTYRVKAADQVLHVPWAPLFSLKVLHSPGSVYAHHLSFDSEHGLREICERSLRDGGVIGPAALNLYPWMFASGRVKQWAAATCGSTQDKVLVPLCRLADQNHPVRRLDRVAIYGPEMKQAIANSLVYAVEYRMSQQLAIGLSPQNLPPPLGRTDVYETYPNGLWIARAADDATTAAEPFVLMCDGDELSNATNAMLCVAQDTDVSGLRLKFLIRTNGQRLTADTQAIRQFLRELIESLRGLSGAS